MLLLWLCTVTLEYDYPYLEFQQNNVKLVAVSWQGQME